MLNRRRWAWSIVENCEFRWFRTRKTRCALLKIDELTNWPIGQLAELLLSIRDSTTFFLKT